MEPSFAKVFFASQRYVDWVIDALRTGRVAVAHTTETDNAWQWRTERRWSWSPTTGFACTSRTFEGTDPDALTHRPDSDAVETAIPEEKVRAAVRTHRASNGFRALLAASLRDDAFAALAAGDTARACDVARRLVGAASPDRATPFEVVACALDAGDRSAAEALAVAACALLERPGVEVFGIAFEGITETLHPGALDAARRADHWLGALDALSPKRGEFMYWRAAAREILGRRDEAAVDYVTARTRGRVSDYHTEVRPADLDPPLGRRALHALRDATRPTG